MSLQENKEIILNKNFKVHNRKAVLATIRFKERTCEVLTVHDYPARVYEPLENKEDMYKLTRREYLKKSLFFPLSIFISKIIVHDHTIVCHSNSTIPLSETEWENLQNSGVDLSVLGQTDISKLSLSINKFSQKSLPLGIDLTKTAMTIKTKHLHHCYMHIGLPLTLKLKEPLPNERLSFFDEYVGCNRYFYVNSIRYYDPTAEYDENAQTYNETLPADKKISDAELAQNREIFINTLAEQFPADADVYLLEYESEDNMDLMFYESGYLNKKVNDSDSFSSFWMALYPQDTEAPNGFRPRQCHIALPKNTPAELSIELFSGRIELDGETIEL